MRVNFGDGQEIILSDLNKLQQVREKDLYDRVVYQLLQQQSNGFLNDSFLVTLSNLSTVSVKNGLGFQLTTPLDPNEPTFTPIYLSVPTTLAIAPAHPTLNRFDSIVVNATSAATKTEARRYKAAIESRITSQTFDTEIDWTANVQVITGTPGTPHVEPPLPDGTLLLASVLIVANVGATEILDKRSILPVGPTIQIDTTSFINVTRDAKTRLSKILSEMDSKLAPLTDKGDILARTDDKNTRLPVGPVGSIISADPTQETGLKWIPNAAAVFNLMYSAVVGSREQVAAGLASHSSLVEALAFVSEAANPSVLVLVGTYNEDVFISTTSLRLIGQGSKSHVKGIFISGDMCLITDIFTESLTIDSDNCFIKNTWLSNGGDFINNGKNNVIEVIGL